MRPEQGPLWGCDAEEAGSPTRRWQPLDVGSEARAAA
jgi:hypothetical protein